jgi:hypothetical protein
MARFTAVSGGQMIQFLNRLNGTTLTDIEAQAMLNRPELFERMVELIRPELKASWGPELFYAVADFWHHLDTKTVEVKRCSCAHGLWVKLKGQPPAHRRLSRQTHTEVAPGVQIKQREDGLIVRKREPQEALATDELSCPDRSAARLDAHWRC